MIKLIEDWLGTFPDRDSAVARMHEHHVPAAPVLSIEETVQPSAPARSRHGPHDHRSHSRQVRDSRVCRFRFSEFPKDLPLQAATLGQHNEEVLRDLLGRTPKEIEELRAAQVLLEGEV